MTHFFGEKVIQQLLKDQLISAEDELFLKEETLFIPQMTTFSLTFSIKKVILFWKTISDMFQQEHRNLFWKIFVQAFIYLENQCDSIFLSKRLKQKWAVAANSIAMEKACFSQA